MAYTFKGEKQNIVWTEQVILENVRNYKTLLKKWVEFNDKEIKAAINRGVVLGYSAKEIEVDGFLASCKLDFSIKVGDLLGKLKGFIDSAFQKGEKEKLYDEIEVYAHSLEKEYLTLEIYTDYLAQFEEKKIV